MSDTSDSSVEATTSYDTGYVESYEVTSTGGPYDAVPAFDPGVPVTATDSSSYDSTDYSVVAEVSEAHMDDYQAAATVSNDLYQASVDAYLAGDDMAAYELNQASIAADSAADASWTESGNVWTSMEETTTVTSYDVDSSYTDTSYTDTSYTDTSYVDTSYVEPVDTSYVDTSYVAPVETTYVEPVVDTSYVAPVDTSYTTDTTTTTDY